MDPDRIAAKYDQGILTITIPKAERARPREIPVKVDLMGAPRVEPPVSGGSSYYEDGFDPGGGVKIRGREP